ncbi:MAG: hypothetical protein JXR19_01385 [Bacteroidia bacterium]
MANSDNSGTKSNKGSLVFFIILFGLSMALNLFLFFKYAKNGANLEHDNQALLAVLNQSQLQADSLKRQLDQTYADLENSLNRNLELSGENDQFRQEIQEKLAELKQSKYQIASLISQGASQGSSAQAYGTLASAQQEIAKLKEENAKFSAELDESRRLYEIARNAVDVYSMDAQTNRNALDSIATLYGVLNQSLEGAKKLAINELNITPLRYKGDEAIPSYKASKISKIKISFRIKASNLVSKGEKNIAFRILGTSGEVLANNVQSLTDSDELVSAEQSVDYDGNDQIVTIYFSQDASFRSGLHKLEILHQGSLLDKQEFQLY